MLLNSLCRKFIWTLALFFALATALFAEAASITDAAGVFLRDLKMPEAVSRALLKKIENGERALRVAESDAGIFSFSISKARRDRDADVQSKLERADAELQALRARRALALHLTAGKLDRKHYHDDDALSGALLSHYRRGVAGLQSASDVASGWAMALVWFESGAARAALEAMPETGELNDDYCALLYDRAKNFFDTGRYAEALPIFKHIHDFRWANIGAYTDAADCFLKMGEPAETLKLLKELVDTLGDDMGSDELARAGRLFREAGDRAAALSAFKLARERFHQGR